MLTGMIRANWVDTGFSQEVQLKEPSPMRFADDRSTAWWGPE